MSNLIAFNNVVKRANRAEEKRVSFDDSITVNVPATVVIFADDTIRALKAQVAKLQEEARRLRIEAMTVSGEELNCQHNTSFKYNGNGDAIIMANGAKQ